MKETSRQNVEFIPREKQLKTIWKTLRKSRTAMFGLCVLAFLALVAIFADLIVPYSKATELSLDVLVSPCAAHPFGTDDLGRDVFARVVHGTRYSLLVGVSVSFLSLFVSMILASLASYYGGKVDYIIMRIMDIFMCIPMILLALAIVAALGPGLVNLMIALTISSIPGKVRLIRSVMLGIREQEYIQAARSYGCSDLRIMFRHVLPNALGPIIVNTTMSMGSLILAASGLSYIGMGIQPPRPEWGAILSDARNYMSIAPYVLVFPGVAILLAALSINLVGDGLRDAFDPRLKDNER